MSRGGRREGAGRKPGSQNKDTREFRETVRQLLAANAENVALWLSQVAEKDPDKALDKLVRLAEYAAPKLGRIEHSGVDGAPIETRTEAAVKIEPGDAYRRLLNG